MSTEMNERLRNTWSILFNYNKQAAKFIRQYLYFDDQPALYQLTDSFKKIQGKMKALKCKTLGSTPYDRVLCCACA